MFVYLLVFRSTGCSKCYERVLVKFVEEMVSYGRRRSGVICGFWLIFPGYGRKMTPCNISDVSEQVVNGFP